MLPRALTARMGLFRQARPSRRGLVLIIVLCGWGWVGVAADPAAAQSSPPPPVNGTIVGQMQGPHIQYGLSVFLQERRLGRARVDGLLVAELYGRERGVLQVRTDMHRGSFIRDSSGDVAGACLEGSSDVTMSDGRVDRGVRTLICVSADMYEIDLTFPDGTRVNEAGDIETGGNRFAAGFHPASLVGGVGEGTDRSGDNVRLATGLALSEDGAVMGGVAAARFNPTSVDIRIVSELDRAGLELSRRLDVEAVALAGAAFVEHDGENCSGALSAQVNVETGLTSIGVPSCEVRSTSQANRRYLYFAKTAD